MTCAIPLAMTYRMTCAIPLAMTHRMTCAIPLALTHRMTCAIPLAISAATRGFCMALRCLLFIAKRSSWKARSFRFDGIGLTPHA